VRDPKKCLPGEKYGEAEKPRVIGRQLFCNIRIATIGTEAKRHVETAIAHVSQTRED